jgi:hypothetical protein
VTLFSVKTNHRNEVVRGSMLCEGLLTSPDPAPAMDRRTPSSVARHRSSMGAETWRSDQWLGRETGHNRGHSRSIHPHYLSRYASKYDFGKRLIRILQPSILGLWLKAIHAGVSPACHQTISSPHVQPFVLRPIGLNRGSIACFRIRSSSDSRRVPERCLYVFSLNFSTSC